jgi:hypothetical protein
MVSPGRVNTHDVGATESCQRAKRFSQLLHATYHQRWPTWNHQQEKSKDFLAETPALSIVSVVGSYQHRLFKGTALRLYKLLGDTPMSTRAIYSFVFLVFLFTIPSIAQIQVLTQHYNNTRTGANLDETILTPSNVVWTKFGKLFSHSVDGAIVGQALYLPAVSIPGKGVHNVVYVATMNDSVYAFDAESGAGSNASPLWKTRVLPTGATAVPISVQRGYSTTGWAQVGVASTPVIDSTTKTLYLIAKDYLNGVATNRLYGLNVATGAEKFSPVTIAASFTSGGKKYVFDNFTQINRPALLLENGILYIGFGSNGGNGFEEGWVLAYGISNSTPNFRGAFNDEPGRCCAAVWQTGGGLSADSAGNVYAETGDGYVIAGTNFGESILKLTLTSGGLTLADWFTPYNWEYLWKHDMDLTTSPLILPTQTGAHPYLAIGVGKEGTLYVLDRTHMGHLCTTCTNGDTQIVQELPNAIGGGLNQSLAYWNETVYTFGQSSSIKAWALRGGLLSSTPIAESGVTDAWHSGIISANGTSNAIFWDLSGFDSSAVLQAFDANTLQQIYSAKQAGSRDLLPAAAHFAKVMEVNGKVYVGTDSSLVVFGLL